MARTRNRTIEVRGELLGTGGCAGIAGPATEVVRVAEEQRPGGPAQNALIVIEPTGPSGPRARYISWIGYYDIEEAQALEPDQWHLVEPARTGSWRVEWSPFGWPGMWVLPNHSPVLNKETP